MKQFEIKTDLDVNDVADTKQMMEDVSTSILRFIRDNSYNADQFTVGYMNDGRVCVKVGNNAPLTIFAIKVSITGRKFLIAGDDYDFLDTIVNKPVDNLVAARKAIDDGDRIIAQLNGLFGDIFGPGPFYNR